MWRVVKKKRSRDEMRDFKRIEPGRDKVTRAISAWKVACSALPGHVALQKGMRAPRRLSAFNRAR
jgi:hypothetical protein